MSRSAKPIRTIPATTPATIGMMSGPEGHSVDTSTKHYGKQGKTRFSNKKNGKVGLVFFHASFSLLTAVISCE